LNTCNCLCFSRILCRCLRRKLRRHTERVFGDAGGLFHAAYSCTEVWFSGL